MTGSAVDGSGAALFDAAESLREEMEQEGGSPLPAPRYNELLRSDAVFQNPTNIKTMRLAIGVGHAPPAVAAAAGGAGGSGDGGSGGGADGRVMSFLQPETADHDTTLYIKLRQIQNSDHASNSVAKG